MKDQAAEQNREAAGGKPGRDLIILLLLAAVLILVNIWSLRAFYCNDEYLYGKMAREMLDRGDLWSPTYFGAITYTKPPFAFWLMMAGYALFGPSVVAVRLSVAFISLLTVLVVFLLAEQLYDRKKAFLCTFIFITSFGFIEYSRIGQMEMHQMFFYALALYFFIRAWKEESPLLAALFWAVSGASSLVKGPVSTVILALCAFVFLLIFKRWKTFFNLRAMTGFAAGLFFILLWPLAIYMKGEIKPWLDLFVIGENFQRVAVAKRDPVSGLIINYLLRFLPWTFLFLAALPALFRKRRILTPAYVLPVLWFMATLLIFSLPGPKLKYYLLPALPAASFILGSLWVDLRETFLFKAAHVMTAFLFAILLLALLALARIFPSGPPIFILIAGILTSLLLLFFTLKRDILKTLSLYAALLFFFLLLMPWLNCDFLPKEAMGFLGDRKTPVGVSIPGIMPHAYAFFLDRPVIQIENPKDIVDILGRGGRVIISQSRLEEAGKVLEPPGLPTCEKDFTWERWKSRLGMPEIKKALTDSDLTLLREPIFILKKREP